MGVEVGVNKSWENSVKNGDDGDLQETVPTFTD